MLNTHSTFSFRGKKLFASEMSHYEITAETGWRYKRKVNEQPFVHLELFESELSNYKTWPIILDEILRLASQTSPMVLDLVVTENSIFSWHQLANLIFRKPDFDSNLEIFERENNRLNIRFEIIRTVSPPTFSGITVGIIHSGNRNTVINEQLDSLIQSAGKLNIPIQVVILSEEFDENYPDSVQVICSTAKNLSQKKNLVIENSRYSHVAIFHDRFVISSNWFASLIEFGPDFDVLGCRQITTEGSRAGDFVASSSEWSWSKSVLLDYEDYSPYHYTNGGVIIGRKEVFATVPWNEYLGWNEAEDIELTRSLTNSGYVSRFSPQIEVTTPQVRPNYIESFAILPDSGDKYNLLLETPVGFTSVVSSIIIDQKISFAKTINEELHQLGVYVHSSEWKIQNNCLQPTSSRAKLQLRIDSMTVGKSLRIQFNNKISKKTLIVHEASEFLLFDRDELPSKISSLKIQIFNKD